MFLNVGGNWSTFRKGNASMRKREKKKCEARTESAGASTRSGATVTDSAVRVAEVANSKSRFSIFVRKRTTCHANKFESINRLMSATRKKNGSPGICLMNKVK